MKMDSSEDNDVSIPDELVDKLLNFQQDFEKMSEVLSPLSTVNINSTDHQIDPLDRARLNLVSGFALNSLFWMYLKTLGINPKEHKIKGELERYKHYITSIKDMADDRATKAPTLDKGAAQRFVRNALWTPKDSETQNASSSSMEQDEDRNEPVREKHEKVLSPSRGRFVTKPKKRRT